MVRGAVMRRLTWCVILACALGWVTGATAAKPTKPARVQASADFIWVDNCAFGGVNTTTGHIEIDAYDDDLVMGPNSWDPQADRISMQVTWASGQVWSPDTIAVTIDQNEAVIAVGSWYTSWTIHDGGNPGTALTGGTFNGVPETADWATFRGLALCGRGMYYLTSGNIKITR